MTERVFMQFSLVPPANFIGLLDRIKLFGDPVISQGKMNQISKKIEEALKDRGPGVELIDIFDVNDIITWTQMETFGRPLMEVDRQIGKIIIIPRNVYELIEAFGIMTDIILE